MNSSKRRRRRDDLDLSLPAYVIGKTLRLLSDQKLKEDNKKSTLEMETNFYSVKNDGSLQSKLKKTVMFRDESGFKDIKPNGKYAQSNEFSTLSSVEVGRSKFFSSWIF